MEVVGNPLPHMKADRVDLETLPTYKYPSSSIQQAFICLGVSMNIFGSIGGFFKRLGSFLFKGMTYAIEKGLTDELVKLALGFVREAADKLVNNTEKREYIVRELMNRGVPESLSRLAVELAVMIYKKEVKAFAEELR